MLWIFVAPLLTITGWYWDFGRQKEALDVLDFPLFGIAVLYGLYGLNRRAFEWGLRIAFILYLLFVVYIISLVLI